jgi:hypothetical protein
MGDSEPKDPGTVPEWQRPTAQEAAGSEANSPSDVAPPVTLQQARRFLQDEDVQKYPREKKIEFLKGKGLEEDVIQHLLQEEAHGSAPEVSSRPFELC